MKKESCIFCKIVLGEVNADKILDRENFIVILDNNPKVEMHSLVIPKEHFETFLDLPKDLYKELLEVTKEASTLLCQKVGTKAFNLINNNFSEAGQVVPHFHLHILPRKENDGFNVSC